MDETYARIINTIPDRHKEKAIRILQLLVFSERPLRIEELVDAIAVDPHEAPYFDPKNRMPIPREISEYCSSLVVLVATTSPRCYEDDVKIETPEDSEDDMYPMFADDSAYNSEDDSQDDDEEMRLQLAHFSVKEYLISDRLEEHLARHFQVMAARTSLATVCLAYMLHLGQDIPLGEITQSFPFAEYCARYWIVHAAARKDRGETLHRLAMELFLIREQAYRNCFRLRYHLPGSSIRLKETTLRPALWYAAYEGLEYEVQGLLEHHVDVNAEDSRCALQDASENGHVGVVRLLLDKGVDVNAPGGTWGNALLNACTRGHEEVVKLLIDRGASIDAGTEIYGNPLQAASLNGHERITELLLDRGADVNARCGYYGNALGAASTMGHTSVVKLLLDKGVNVDDNALTLACYQGLEEIVKLLLDRGANNNNGAALSRASRRGHEGLVKLLLDKGADVDDHALAAASWSGHEGTVKLLLDKSASVDGNALAHACEQGHEGIVKLLLGKGANASGGGALAAASRWGQEGAVKLLLEKGADVDDDALAAASSFGHEEITKLLLDRRASREAGT